MTCSHCGYFMDALDKTCPRCYGKGAAQPITQVAQGAATPSIPMTHCGQCGTVQAATNACCQHCGAGRAMPQTQFQQVPRPIASSNNRTLVILLVILALIGVPFFLALSSTPGGQQRAPSFSPVTSAFSAPVVTMSEFNALQTGTSYSQTVATIGAQGEVASTNTLQGAPGVMPDVTTTMYVWKNADGSNMNAMFQNDRLISKAQFGLS